MKKLLFSLCVLLSVTAVPLTSCSSDDPDPDNGSQIKPDVEVADPEGTITLSMRNYDNGRTWLGNIYIDDENFCGSGEVYFASVGAVKGLGNVTNIPKSGWARQVSVIPGHGYVAYDSYKQKYYRIYVVDNILTTGNLIIGAEVKYQEPFKGLDQDISIDSTNYSFNGEGQTHTIWFKNSNIVLFDVEASESWCKVSKVSSLNEPFLYNGIAITVDKMNSGPKKCTVKISTAYNKERVINVEYLGFEPYVKIGDASELSNVPWQGDSYYIPIESNCLETLEFSHSDWTKVSISDNRLKIVVSENPFREERTDIIKVSSSIGINEDIQISVKQDWHKYIENWRESWSTTGEFPSNPGTGNHRQFRFKTSYHPGEIECITDYGDQPEWFTVDFRWNGANGYTDGYVDVENVDINDTGKARTATVTLKSTDGENSLVYTIKQY